MSKFWCLFRKENESGNNILYFYDRSDGHRQLETSVITKAKRFITQLDAEKESPDLNIWRPILVDWIAPS